MTDFARRVLVGTLIVAAIALVLLFLKTALSALLLAFAGVLLAIIWRGAADRLGRALGLKTAWSLLVVALVAAAALGAFVLFAAPEMLQQVRGLNQTLPQSVSGLRDWMSQSEWGQSLLAMMPAASDIDPRSVLRFLTRATGVAYTALEVLFSSLVVAFVTIYVAADPHLYIDGTIRLIPRRHRRRAAEVVGAIGHTLGWWLVASLIKMTAVGLLTWIGLTVLGVPMATLLALLAFVLDFVPYFGPIAAAAPAILVAISQGPSQALYVALLYFIVQQIEGFVVSPVLFQRTVRLPPVLTIMAQIVLGSIAGVMGVVLATPLTAAALVAFKMLYVEDVLGDDMDVVANPVRSPLAGTMTPADSG